MVPSTVSTALIPRGGWPMRVVRNETLRIVYFLVLAAIVLSKASSTIAEDVFLREDFKTLEQWDPLIFPKIKRRSTYTVNLELTDNWVLKTSSNASASGLICKRTYNVFDYPRLHWRWKVENIYTKGDAKKKSGDDYPLRVYVTFEFDPKMASWWKRAQYQTARVLYGTYPPDSTVNYVWANRAQATRVITSPYTDSSKLIILQAGQKRTGEWIEEVVNVLDDYRRAFGHDLPKMASLAIMNDSDNTGETSVSYLDFIEVLPP